MEIPGWCRVTNSIKRSGECCCKRKAGWDMVAQAWDPTL